MTEHSQIAQHADAALETATQHVRMILLGTGSVTSDEVDRDAQPLAQALLAAVRPALRQQWVAETYGHASVIRRRLEALKSAIGQRDWFSTEFSFDQVLGAVAKAARTGGR